MSPPAGPLAGAAPRWCLILALAASPAFSASTAPASPALASVQACAAGLDSLDIGYDRIAERCPGLASALEASGYAPWLPADWKRSGNELSGAGLTQLQRLLQRELAAGVPAAPGSAARVPDVRHLASVLAQLPPPWNGWEPSWDARLGAWLRSRPAPIRGSGPGLIGWLSAAAAPPAMARFALLALVVLAAALLAARELRLLFFSVGGSVRGSVHGAAPAPGPQIDHPPHLSDDSPEPLGALLAGVAARLAAQGRLPGSRTLTARELVRAARLPPELLRALAALAGVSEQLAYAPQPPSLSEIEAAKAQGRQLLAQLDGGLLDRGALDRGA